MFKKYLKILKNVGENRRKNNFLSYLNWSSILLLLNPCRKETAHTIQYLYLQHSTVVFFRYSCGMQSLDVWVGVYSSLEHLFEERICQGHLQGNIAGCNMIVRSAEWQFKLHHYILKSSIFALNNLFKINKLPQIVWTVLLVTSLSVVSLQCSIIIVGVYCMYCTTKLRCICTTKLRCIQRRPRVTNSGEKAAV